MATGVCVGAFWSGVIGQALISTPCSSARSLPVRTASTLGEVFAAADVDRGDRGVGEGAAHHGQVQHPGQGEVVGPAGAAGDQPLVLLATPVPPDLGGGPLLGGGHAAGPRCVLHGLHDVVVAGAPAEVALEPEPDLLLGRVRVLLEQVDALHDHPRRAEPALQAVALAEGLLHGVQLTVLREPLDGGDLAAVGLDGEHVARLHAGAVEVHGARAAVAGVAADDGAGLAELLAQVLHEEHAGFDVVGDLVSVDGEADPGHGGTPVRGRRVMPLTLGREGWEKVAR